MIVQVCLGPAPVGLKEAVSAIPRNEHRFNVGTDLTEPFPSWLCLADLQYVDGLGEPPGFPGAAAELAEDLPGLELGVRSFAGSAEFRVRAVRRSVTGVRIHSSARRSLVAVPVGRAGRYPFYGGRGHTRHLRRWQSVACHLSSGRIRRDAGIRSCPLRVLVAKDHDRLARSLAAGLRRGGLPAGQDRGGGDRGCRATTRPELCRRAG